MLEVGRELGTRWKQLDKEQQAVFEEKARENRVSYEKELTVYKSKEHSSPATTLIDCQDAAEFPNIDSNLSGSSPISFLATSSPADPVPIVPTNIVLEDLGFAKQKGYSFHPALKTGELARGTRIKVTYFGTGQTGTVDRAKWLKFSLQAAEDYNTKTEEVCCAAFNRWFGPAEESAGKDSDFWRCCHQFWNPFHGSVG